MCVDIYFLFLIIVTTVDCMDHKVSVLEGEDVSLACVLPPYVAENVSIHQVNWTYNGSDVITMDEHVMEGYKERYALYRPYQGDWFLKINPTQSTDKGNYTCSAGTDFESVTSLTVESRPVVIGYQSRRLFIQACDGVNLTLWCNVTGIPYPSVKWFFKKQDNTQAKYIGLSIEKLFIRDIREKSSGIYFCNVTNRHGTTLMDFDVTVIVRSPCIVMTSPFLTPTTSAVYITSSPKSSSPPPTLTVSSTSTSSVSVSALVTILSDSTHVTDTRAGATVGNGCMNTSYSIIYIYVATIVVFISMTRCK